MRGGKAKAKSKGKGALDLYEGEYKGDLLIQYLWDQGMDSIHDMRVVNTDALSWKSKTPKKCLETAGWENKKKYLHTCFNERRHFTTFVASVDGLIVVEAEVTLKHITSRLAT